jgi:NhaA family Na+:H+ antiporter
VALHTDDDPTPPPWSWAPARAVARGILAPLERFFAWRSASSVLLLGAAALALLWANSPWKESYAAVWETPLGARWGALAFERSLGWWINDGLMAIFFFVVGLEIRREIHGGALADLRRAALPLAAALGGMVVPALIFASVNRGLPTIDGWGIPMATDIAFAIGVLALLGKRAPPAMRVLLLALAVIDDVGAILVIAIFYSSGIEPAGLLVVAGGIAGVLVLRAAGVRSAWIYVVPALVVWGGAYASGVHPTVAGVIVGLLTPVSAWHGEPRFGRRVTQHVDAYRAASDEHARFVHLDRLRVTSLEAVAPVERLQHRLHGFFAFFIMPVFALANAGVTLGSAEFTEGGVRLFGGIALGLVAGKLVGIVSFAWLAVRLGLAVLPAGVSWRGVTVVGLVAGIGFTMSLFIANLALPPGPLLETAKLAVLAGSCLAALLAVATGWFVLAPPRDPGAERAAREAERVLPR